jgi:RNA polymerase sigma-70 factor, ECF subfamily
MQQRESTVERMSSEELVDWCRRTLPEDTRAFEYLVAQYRGRVYSTTYRIMGNPQEAEDQAQEVFLKIFRGIRTIQEPATLPSWITRIAINTCMDAISRQQRRPQTTPLLATTPDGESEEEIRYVDTRTLTPEEAALRSELRHCLERALTNLDPSARTALILRDIDDHSYQEIAETLSLGLSAVKMRIHRARLSFQQALEKICPDAARSVRRIDPQSAHS